MIKRNFSREKKKINLIPAALDESFDNFLKRDCLQVSETLTRFNSKRERVAINRHHHKNLLLLFRAQKDNRLHAIEFCFM